VVEQGKFDLYLVTGRGGEARTFGDIAWLGMKLNWVIPCRHTGSETKPGYDPVTFTWAVLGWPEAWFISHKKYR
jgi:hypothetical protein